jgi:hypothetical protein
VIETEKSDSHSEKHFSRKKSTDEGRMISIKPVRMNASPSIRDNLGPDSNVIEESDLQSEKHFKPKTSIDPGNVTNSRSVPENASLSIFLNFDPVSNPID